jgi:lipid-binding SYLF domain-containing protein
MLFVGCAARQTTSTAPTPDAGAARTAAANTPRTDETQEALGDQAERLRNAIEAFNAVMGVPDQSIPQELLDRAECVAVVPNMKKAAFVVGGKYGVGFFSCRARANDTGWTPPATVRLEGGSFGFQIGAEETDLILLVMNEQGRDRLLRSQFQMGGEVSVAAGPVGRSAAASTDALMTAQILSYSRSRGVFAGAALQGTTVRPDPDENRQLYGQPLTNEQIINGGVQVQVPDLARQFSQMLTKYSPREINQQAPVQPK